MALSIINNPTALGATSSLNSASSKLSKTIAQLSTGLRINSAADDASGLAVSEKLRGQISGLKVAASNSQDAISMLQTAEGAMGSMTSIIQRMRELAVQSGNPAYTTNDRAMLQLEMDQLKEEIDRVATTTEFNTKKLLNGDAAALWSSTNTSVEAIIKGTAAGGSYKLQSYVDPGKNSIYQSRVMTIQNNKNSYDIKTNGTSIQKLSNMENMIRDKDNISTAVASGTIISVGSKATGTITAKVGILGSTMGGITSALYTRSAASTFGSDTYVEIEALSSRTVASASASARIRFTDAKTGQQTEWIDAVITSAKLTLVDKAKGVGIFGNTSNAISTAGITLTGLTAINAGEKVLLGKSSSASLTNKDSIHIGGKTAANSLGISFADGVLVDPNYNKTTTIHTAQMDKSGKVHYGKMDVTFGKASDISTAQKSFEMTVNVLAEGDQASKYTILSDISNYTNSDGRNVLDNTQELTIYGKNSNTVVTFEASDTISEIENKLSSALIEQLGMGAANDNANAADVNSNLVNFVDESNLTPGSSHSLKGTFVIQTALLGKESNLAFSGDQGLIDALGLQVIQENSDSALTVTVTDARTGTEIGKDTVTDGVLRGVIEGVDVKIDPTIAADSQWNNTSKSLEFTGKAAGDITFITVTENSTIAAVGANEGQTLDLSIGRVDTKGLNISDVKVTSIEDAQSSITKLDQATEKLSKARAIAGSQMNRLDYTINNLNTARENLTASESRIRDLDIAQASSDLTARQVMIQTATAMLAQANQIPSYAAQLIR